MTFENIVGNDAVKQILNKTIQTKSILHSYLFVGEEGIGKQLFAKEFARMILCVGTNKQTCRECKSCIELAGGNNPDYQIIQTTEGRIKIEQIRLLQTQIAQKPIISNRKVCVINDSDMMTNEAQNCLLKTLEEPPEYMTLILVASNENRILNTIKSRCIKVTFHKIEDNMLGKLLEEKIQLRSISESMLRTFDGSVKKALMIQENIELYQKIEKIFFHIEDKNIVELWKEAECIYQAKETIEMVLDYIVILLYTKMKENLKESSKYNNSIQIVEQTKKNMRANANFDMSIDNMLLGIGKEMSK